MTVTVRELTYGKAFRALATREMKLKTTTINVTPAAAMSDKINIAGAQARASFVVNRTIDQNGMSKSVTTTPGEEAWAWN
jgi:hypothetical protein